MESIEVPRFGGIIATVAELEGYALLKLVAGKLPLRDFLVLKGVLLEEVLSLKEVGDHEEAAELEEQQAGQHRPASIGVAVVVEVLLLVVVALLHRVSPGVVAAGGGERTWEELAGVAGPVKAIEEGVRLQIAYPRHSQPLLGVEAQQAVDEVGELRRNPEGVELVLAVVGEAGVVSSDHVKEKHPQRPEVRSASDWLVVELLGRNEGRGEDGRRNVSLGVKVGQVGGKRVAVFADHNIFMIDAAIYYLQGVQVFQREDEAGEDEADVGLEVRAEVGFVLGVVREDIEVEVAGEVEIEAQVGVVFVEVQAAHDEARVVVGSHQILDRRAPPRLLRGEPLLLHPLHDARLEPAALLHQRRCQVFRDFIGRDGGVRVDAPEHPKGSVRCALLELHHRDREIAKKFFLRLCLLLMLDSSALVLPHVAVVRGHNLTPVSVETVLLLTAYVSHLQSIITVLDRPAFQVLRGRRPSPPLQSHCAGPSGQQRIQ